MMSIEIPSPLPQWCCAEETLGSMWKEVVYQSPAETGGTNWPGHPQLSSEQQKGEAELKSSFISHSLLVREVPHPQIHMLEDRGKHYKNI
jgi:hypothetical protein